jgi:hypothetical protein
MADPEQDPIDLAESLRTDILRMLREDWGLEPVPLMSISNQAIFEVTKSVDEAIKDFRHQYYKNVATIKYIATVMFWIIRCKPVNTCLYEADGTLVDAPGINEHIALSWGLQKIILFAREGKMRELIAPTRRNLANLEKIIHYYRNGDIYRSVTTGKRIHNTTKYSETIYYFQYKKITSVYIYEILLHLLVSYKALYRA